MTKLLCIYLIKNIINGKVYVGQTKNPHERWKSHKGLARRGKNHYLYKSIKYYGICNFTFTIIERCSSQEEVDVAEDHWINYYNSRNLNFGYNIRAGGSRGPHSKETNLKISKAAIGRVSHMKGKTFPKWFGQKISKAKKGKPGHLHSEETKLKISQSNKGTVPWIKGKFHSEETKKKMSIAKIGNFHSEESKKKMSDSAKATR